MTHDELIAEINAKINLTNYHDDALFEIIAAIRAVVELHEPLGNVCNWCTCHDCEHIVDYPCKTIRAIEKAFE